MTSSDHRRSTLTPTIVAAIAVALAIAVMALSGLGTRWGLWNFRTGFVILKWSVYAALAGAAVAFVTAFVAPGPDRTRTAIVAAVAVIVGLGAASVPWRMLRAARALPPIHDITTDTQNPPVFVALYGHRLGAANSADYGGPETAALQASAYPDIRPVVLPVSPAVALDRAVAAARSMGWTIVAVDSATGRLEASDRTAWFGFTDDIVVRVRPEGNGARVDARSVSRVGKSDVGTNARRLRAYLGRLRASP